MNTTKMQLEELREYVARGIHNMAFFDDQDVKSASLATHYLNHVHVQLSLMLKDIDEQPRSKSIFESIVNALTRKTT